MVSKSVFSDFWSAWYGPILKLAYQKPGRVLWDKRFELVLINFLCVLTGQTG